MMLRILLLLSHSFFTILSEVEIVLTQKLLGGKQGSGKVSGLPVTTW